MRKIPFAGIELTSQRVRGYMVPLSYRGDRQRLCIYSLCISILLLPCLMVYYIVSVFKEKSECFYCFFWSPCMAINVSVQYNGGFLPDIILSTQCYFHFHRETRLYAMKRFVFAAFDPTYQVNVLTFPPP